MAAINPVDRWTADEKLSIERASFARLGDDEATFLGILAHVPDYAEALWGAMSEALFEGNVDHRLKEMIRIQLARRAGDPYFSKLRSKPALEAGLTEDDIEAASGDFENDPRFSDAEKWALRYAYLMFRDPEKIDTAFYDQGKKHFTEAQIMELGGLIAIHYGMDVFMRTLQPGEN
ncbi:MAG TPA: carboxymuconolactone decarboxylase family protein [Acidimicrobiia bacterium]